MPSRLRILSSKTLYKGRVIELKLDRVIEPGGIEATRELVCHPGSVVVVPRMPDGRVVMIRQYRYAARRWLWELVAGGLEPGETPLRAARRELLEETGYRGRSFKLWVDYFASPGVMNERMFVVEARGLTLTQAAREKDENIVEVRSFTPRQLRKMLMRKEFHDGKTLVGLLWLLHKYCN